MNDKWHRQTLAEPLFPDLLWSRPENKLNAGRLLIVGGSASSISEASLAYAESSKAGIGETTVLLPDSVKKIVGPAFAAADFAPSTRTGEFGGAALAELIDLASRSSVTLFVGQMGGNSETAIMLDKFFDKTNPSLVITSDSFDLLMASDVPMTDKTNVALVVTMAQLQKLAAKLRSPKPVRSDMALTNLVELLEDFSKAHPLALITKLDNYLIGAYAGQVVTTQATGDDSSWQIRLSVHLATWLAQNPNHIFEAISCSMITYQS